MSLTKKDLLLIRELVREEVQVEAKPLKNDIVQFKDDILHEIQSLREEIAIVVGYRGMIANHEERLETVEDTLGIIPA